MSDEFTGAFDDENDDQGGAEAGTYAGVAGVKNYITPGGLQRLRDELRFLLTRERPAVTQVVAWAAGNGDRSENADYQYGKRRLRQIDRRIHFLRKRIDAAQIVDPEAPRVGRAATHVFFGATVRYTNDAGTERIVSIVGVDEDHTVYAGTLDDPSRFNPVVAIFTRDRPAWVTIPQGLITFETMPD